MEAQSLRTDLFERCYDLGLGVEILVSDTTRIKIYEGSTILNEVSCDTLEEAVEKQLKYLDEL